jgi:hypothetical protein
MCPFDPKIFQKGQWPGLSEPTFVGNMLNGETAVFAFFINLSFDTKH